MTDAAIILVLLYMIPTIIATVRWAQSGLFGKQLVNVIVVNYFLGWTVIGWFVALAMACKRNGVTDADIYDICDRNDL